jgi:hypothetical protein
MNRQPFCGSTAIFSVQSFAGKDTIIYDPANAQKIKENGRGKRKSYAGASTKCPFLCVGLSRYAVHKVQSFGPLANKSKKWNRSRLSLLFFLFTLTPIHSLFILWGV